MSVLELQDISYSYDGTVPVLSHQSYAFERGKIYAVAGNPGTGKTTLLCLLAGLADPTSGTILYDGKNLREMDHCHYRSHTVGTVFRGFNLLPQFTALENMEMAIEIAGIKNKDKHSYAVELLERVGLTATETGVRVSKLSEGAKQRAAVARVLAYHPDILLVDEPADTLDGETMQQMITLFTQYAHADNGCVILATQFTDAGGVADEVYTLSPEQKSKSAEPTVG